MRRGISINIGVNNLSDLYDAGVFGELHSCINDANAMAGIARDKGFETIIVLPDATIPQVTAAIEDAAAELRSGDICLITFSGHGSQRRDTNLDETDFGRMDETWCLQDDQLADDDFRVLLTNFWEGVRVLVISDSCHSGTIIDSFSLLLILKTSRAFLLKAGFDIETLERQFLYESGLTFINFDAASAERNNEILKMPEIGVDFTISSLFKLDLFQQKIKNLPPDIIDRMNSNKTNRIIYDEALQRAKRNLEIKLAVSNEVDARALRKASIIQISACQDWQTTKDGTETGNSVFTKALIDVWDNGNFSGSYIKFRDAIYNRLKQEGREQIPKYRTAGTPNADFELQNPFKVEFP